LLSRICATEAIILLRDNRQLQSPTRGSDSINDQAIFGLVVFFCARAAVALIEEQKNQVGARTDSDKLLTD